MSGEPWAGRELHYWQGEEELFSAGQQHVCLLHGKLHGTADAVRESTPLLASDAGVSRFRQVSGSGPRAL